MAAHAADQYQLKRTNFEKIDVPSERLIGTSNSETTEADAQQSRAVKRRSGRAAPPENTRTREKPEAI